MNLISEHIEMLCIRQSISVAVVARSALNRQCVSTEKLSIKNIRNDVADPHLVEPLVQIS
jgi:hypothetical protein